MTILDLLKQAAGLNADTVRNMVRAGGQALGQTEQADQLLAKLDQAIGDDNLIDVAAKILAEIKAGRIDPRERPSDLI